MQQQRRCQGTLENHREGTGNDQKKDKEDFGPWAGTVNDSGHHGGCNEKIMQMAQRIQRDIIRAVDSLKEKDATLARQIIDEGDVVDDMEDEINGDCFTFLANQAPVATDLRYCVSVMKMIRDLERMGDTVSPWQSLPSDWRRRIAFGS